MKRTLLLLTLILSFTAAFAEVSKFTGTELAIKFYNSDYGYWEDWSDWDKCNVLIVINADKDEITIYSDERQEYTIFDSEGEETDSNGTSITFNCVDIDGIRCNVRLRIQNDGQAQLYVDYNDVMWVYNIQPR